MVVAYHQQFLDLLPGSASLADPTPGDTQPSVAAAGVGCKDGISSSSPPSGLSLSPRDVMAMGSSAADPRPCSPDPPKGS